MKEYKVIRVDCWNVLKLEELLNNGWVIQNSSPTRDSVYYILEKEQ